MTVRWKLPSLAPLPETKESQEKGGVELTVTPVSYIVARSSRTTETEIPPPSLLGGLVTVKREPGEVYIEQVVRPVAMVSPDRLRFRIRINNKLPRVFRGSGAVLQFNVSGKLVALEPTYYADLVNAIVPPRSEQVTEVSGPLLSTLPDQTSVGIFLYDIVTMTDNAGNVTEKQNFEWYFNYLATSQEELSPVKRTKLWVKR